MAHRYYYCFLFILIFSIGKAQTDSVQLREVTIADRQLRLYSDSKTVHSIPDSIIRRNAASLSSLLNFESLIYFKENGPGMVSSASFRGTTSQQTAVIWNGLNINSQLNGQTEFNTLTGRDYTEISVRGGGGSLQYGSSAIGGTVHLNTELRFAPKKEHTIEFGYGSFNNKTLNYTYRYADLKFASSISASLNDSENDYPYPGQQRRNENGQYSNMGYNAAIGYKIDSRNTIRFYSQVFEGNRHFSIIHPTDNRSRYADLNTRNMLEWDRSTGNWNSNLKAALLTERYRFYENILQDNYFTGQVQNLIGRYDLSYAISKDIKINALADYNVSHGSGSDITSADRNIFSATLLFNHQMTTRFSYEAGVRSETGARYNSPLLFSGGVIYEVNPFYTVKGNVSGNYRMPSFNDLYWYNAGNTDLLPEQSVQAEVNHVFRSGRFNASLTVYHNNIRDMIRWLPHGGGLSRPENIDRVTVTGAEVMAGTTLRFHRHLFAINGGYSYTHSQNDKLGRQLIYVPYHRARASVQYEYEQFSARLQYLFCGAVFTQTDNDPSAIVGMYQVSNIDLNYSLGKRSQTTIGARIGNLLSEVYESDEGRPFPGRNFNMYLTFNF
jgi:outer membrane cobalamin receptor